MSIKSVMPSNHLILCRPLLLLPSIFPSTRVFSNESVLRIRGPKYWSFSFNISPSSEHPGLIFRMDWLNLLAVQGTLKSLYPDSFFHVNIDIPKILNTLFFSLLILTWRLILFHGFNYHLYVEFCFVFHFCFFVTWHNWALCNEIVDS